jgi:hypothetical protein
MQVITSLAKLYIYIYFRNLTTLSVLRVYCVSNRMINEYGAVRGKRIGKGTEVFGETLPQCHFFSTIISTLSDLGSNPGHCDMKSKTNRLS